MSWGRRESAARTAIIGAGPGRVKPEFARPVRQGGEWGHSTPSTAPTDQRLSLRDQRFALRFARFGLD